MIYINCTQSEHKHGRILLINKQTIELDKKHKESMVNIWNKTITKSGSLSLNRERERRESK